jgi:cytochrome c oxidase subunit 2
MLTKLGLIPEQASTLAGRVDALYFFLIGVTVFFSVLIAVLVLGFAVRYRRSRQAKAVQIHGNLALELLWTGIPFAIAMAIFVWSAQIYMTIVRPPDDALEIFVVGKQWMWKLQHMEGRREINELHVPAGRPVKLTMTSEDVIHSFYVPAFRVKQDVLPGRYTTLWFEATKPGSYHLFCTEYCGTEHSRMIGRVVVLEPHDYADWLTGKGPAGAAVAAGAATAAGGAGPSMADLGKAAFERAACQTCHSVAPAEDAIKVVGPPLHGIFGHSVKLLTGEEVVVDDAYLRSSILEPMSQVVAGYPPAMPPYAGRVSEEEILQIIAYIKSLGAPAAASAAAQPAQ